MWDSPSADSHFANSIRHGGRWMLSRFWIGFGIIAWIFNFMTVGRRIKNGAPLEGSFVRPPFFVYLICGMPKARNIPSGVMGGRALAGQLIGIFAVIYGLIYPYLPAETLLYQAILVYLVGILDYLYVLMLQKRHPYNID
jgi:hypothetical protein